MEQKLTLAEYRVSYTRLLHELKIKKLLVVIPAVLWSQSEVVFFRSHMCIITPDPEVYGKRHFVVRRVETKLSEVPHSAEEAWP